jgi:hypothetical protein
MIGTTLFAPSGNPRIPAAILSDLCSRTSGILNSISLGAQQGAMRRESSRVLGDLDTDGLVL